MKTSVASGKMSLWLSNGLVCACLAAFPSTYFGAAFSAAAADPAVAAPAYSPGVADVVKMADAKVDPEIIKAYIHSSPVAYSPSASEIIALNDRGLPPDVLTAILHRGGELRPLAKIA